MSGFLVVSAAVLVGALIVTWTERAELRQLCKGKSLGQRLTLTGIWMDQPILLEADEQLIALRAALEHLYLENADYIRRNNLGDVHHNRSMQRAKELLDRQ